MNPVKVSDDDVVFCYAAHRCSINNVISCVCVIIKT